MNLPLLDEDLDPEEVVAALASVLGEARCARLDAAARGRLEGVAVLIEELIDPHNYGAVLRSCEAMGVGHVYTINSENRFRVSPRVTQGCEKWLEVERFTNAAECASALHRAGYRVLAAVPGSGLSLDEVATLAGTQHVALAFGNEHLGLSPALRSLADGAFAIPMHGMSQSLNVSVSAAVSLSAVTSVRRRALGRPGDLDPRGELMLRARMYAADVRGVRAIVERRRLEAKGPR